MTPKDQLGGNVIEIEPAPLGPAPVGPAPVGPAAPGPAAPGPASGENESARPVRPGIALRALSAIEARQGVVSGRVVTVLGVSISLALLGIVVAFLVAF
jgi:hypothetical protein